LALPPPSAPRARPNDQPTAAETFAKISHQIAEKLALIDVTRVLIVDFYDPARQATPFGTWLADQIASSPEPAWSQIHQVDRNRIPPGLRALHLSIDDQFDREKAVALAASLSANGVIIGSFGPAEGGIGVSLHGYAVLGKENSYGVLLQTKIPVTAEIQTHLQVPLQSLVPKDGIFIADAGGVSLPTCIHCPNPRFTDEAVRRHIQGIVVLSGVVTPEGRVVNISVEKTLGAGLDDQAVKVVKGWKLKPASDVDGVTVSVRVPIEVQFRLFNQR
jgi:TonB family protein